ncbi:type III secretion system domain-containing protein [Citrobacter sp. ANG330]|uniref:type III secretion system domain-containing protein n=1 Tax=Citrobacter sp. ANG330 TaxID=3048142 RepID=UPI0039C04D23
MSDDKEYVSLYRLFMRPGGYIHEQHWHLSGLANWREDYLAHPALRPEIDRQLRTRLGWSWPGQGSLTSLQRQWVRWLPKLPMIVIALGLLELNCSDYFMLGHYRRPLIGLLGEVTFNQIFALWQGGDDEPAVEPDRLSDVAYKTGTQLFSLLTKDDWVGRLIMPVLPCVDTHAGDVSPEQADLDKLQSKIGRIARFI